MSNETTTETEVIQTFRIPDGNLEALRERLAKLSKKAVKLVGQPIEMKVIATEDVERKSKTPYGETRLDLNGKEIGLGVFDRFHTVTVSGPRPKLAGWTFAAALDVVDVDGEKAVMVRNAPGETIPAHLREHATGCDHCNTERRRKTLYVLRKTP